MISKRSLKCVSKLKIWAIHSQVLFEDGKVKTILIIMFVLWNHASQNQ